MTANSVPKTSLNTIFRFNHLKSIKELRSDPLPKWYGDLCLDVILQ